VVAWEIAGPKRSLRLSTDDCVRSPYRLKVLGKVATWALGCGFSEVALSKKRSIVTSMDVSWDVLTGHFKIVYTSLSLAQWLQ
jgi:hypothetical protein